MEFSGIEEGWRGSDMSKNVEQRPRPRGEDILEIGIDVGYVRQSIVRVEVVSGGLMDQ